MLNDDDSVRSFYAEAAMLDSGDVFRPAGQLGEGWWGDRWKDVKGAAKAVQGSAVVRDFEKGAVKAGSTALRGVAETAVAGLADAAATAVGAPELSAPLDKAIDKGAAALQKKGTAYLDQKIDASGSGAVRYMTPSGGGLRLAGSGTQLGSGLRLAGSGMRLAGSGMRLAGSGMRVRPLVEGGGQACGCSA